MEEKFCFVAVEFINDPNVVGLKYWYLCADETVCVNSVVLAPLGRHNNEQQGLVREVRFAPDYEAPFPIHLIKSIKKVIK
ncbi:MAG: hypothetical protein E7370_01525 [Clostridiales bacterium]|nr:hypothetical protein [Clostridiales bacterium]